MLSPLPRHSRISYLHLTHLFFILRFLFPYISLHPTALPSLPECSNRKAHSQRVGRHLTRIATSFGGESDSFFFCWDLERSIKFRSSVAVNLAKWICRCSFRLASFCLWCRFGHGALFL
ncbi:hypothetical protein Csa_008400 [Cucumis sativus]|nr:hypothetical protein Csa_008400 [Cucumis sativus]